MQRRADYPAEMGNDRLSQVVPRGYRMVPRDLAILRDLWLFRYLTAAQVSRLHVGHLKIAQRRLRKLSTLKVVTRFRLPSAGPFGDQRWIYCLSRSGARHVAAAEGLATTDLLVPFHAPRAPGYLAHHEALTDARIWIREACEARAFAYRFVPAYEEVRQGGVRHRRVALQVGAAQFIPDGVFAIDHPNGFSALFVLEIDRGTEPLHRAAGSSVKGKLVLFREAFDEGLTAYAGLFEQAFKGARLLWVVPDEKRRDAVLDLATREDLATLVWVIVHEQMAGRGALSAPVWGVSGREGLHALDE